jgi:hypothetical protein
MSVSTFEEITKKRPEKPYERSRSIPGGTTEGALRRGTRVAIPALIAS